MSVLLLLLSRSQLRERMTTNKSSSGGVREPAAVSCPSSSRNGEVGFDPYSSASGGVEAVGLSPLEKAIRLIRNPQSLPAVFEDRRFNIVSGPLRDDTLYSADTAA